MCPLACFVVVSRWRNSYLYGHFAPPDPRFNGAVNLSEGFLGEQIIAYLHHKRRHEWLDSGLYSRMDVEHDYVDVNVVDPDESSLTYNPVFNIKKELPEITTAGVVEGKSTRPPLTRSRGTKGISLVVSDCPWLPFFLFVSFFFCGIL